MKQVFDRITGKTSSASAAKERLQLVLIHDRTDFPPGMMEDLRDEILEVISRHIEVDRESVQINIQQEGRRQFLLAEIPIQDASKKRRR